MRYPRKWQLAVVCLLALVLLPFAPAPRGTAQSPGYTITDLGTLGDGAGLESRANGINECGRVVGESQAGPNASDAFHPFLWSAGVMTDLGTLGGSTGTAANVNQSGTAVGSALTSGSLLHPTVWPPDGPTQDIGTLGGFSAEAQDINASGQVVGQSEDGALQDRAFLWQPGVGMQALTAPWGTPIRAFGINDAGQVAGSANRPNSGTHAFVTVGGVALDIGTLGGAVSVATEVNDLGEVSGYSYITVPPNTITQSFHAFRWRDANANGLADAGEMTDLGVLGGHKNSYAYDLNNHGQVVGYSETGAPGNANVTRAFIWTSADGLRDLSAVAPGTGWTFYEARGINDRGQIVGTGLNPDGKVHAFLLTPTDAGPSPCDPTPTPTPVPGTLQFSATAYTVGEGGGSVVISVSREGGDDGSVTVGYATSDGTATAGAGGDYTAASGTLTFADGETTKTFSVAVNDDTLDEPDETVNLTLSTPGGGATLGWPTTVILSITDNDNQPTVQFGSATYSVSEGGTSATITVTRTGGTNGGVTVNYATAGGSATAGAGGDYTAASGTLTFAAGDNSETFTVAVANDALDEADESVYLTLSIPGGGAERGTPHTAILTITDDDATPTLSVNDVTVIEGNTGGSPATTATFAVTLAGASAQDVTVYYSTANGSATQPGDYYLTSGTVTFNPGETGAKNITVPVVGDTTDEPNETFNVNLSNVSASATISDAQGVGTINDDDGAPSLNISDVSVVEGNAGTTAATFTVSLLPASGQTVTVNYATADGTAAAGSDYAAASGTLTFVPGDTSETVTVNVTGETAAEEHESFVVNLSNPTNAGLGDPQGRGAINNDDTTLSIDVSVNQDDEGNSGETSFVFQVRLSHVSALNASVNYSTADLTAKAGEDYVAVSNQTLQISSGSTTGYITVKVKGDNTFEDYEDFVVNLSGAVNAVIGNAQGRARIRNDEAPSLFQVSGPNSNSVGEGGTKATFTITRTGSTAGGATVNYATSDGTATAGADYTAASGSFTFAENETTKTFEVPILNDTLDEPAETVTVSLTPGFGASAGTSSSITLNINDDDDPPTFKFSNDTAAYTLSEKGGTRSITITVTRTGGTNAAAVSFSTSDGTATGESLDYGGGDGTLNFAAGETNKTFDVVVIDDGLDEPNETVNLALIAGPGIALGTPKTAVLTIEDDDEQPTFQFSSSTYLVAENKLAVEITVARTGGSNAAAVNYSVSNGSATAGSDYTAVSSGTLTFAENENSRTINVAVADDGLDEIDETVSFTLGSASGGALGTPKTAALTITDDDAQPTVSITNAVAVEGSNGPVAAAFTVQLSAPSGKAITVNVATSNDTATAGSDYAALPAAAKVTFNPGQTQQPVNVTVLDDTADEPDETFNVTLSSPVSATIDDGAGVGTIADDDAAPSLQLSRADYNINESGGIIPITVTRTGGTNGGVTVNYSVSNGTAAAGSDYTAVSNGTLTFAAGDAEKTFNINVTNDVLDESDETVNLSLSGPGGGAVLGATTAAVLTITDDDGTPSLSINDVTVAEGNSGMTAATFTVTLSAASGQAVLVNYATGGGTAIGTMAQESDYVGMSGQLNFAAGETTKTITVNVNGDTTNEPDETFFVNLSGAANAAVADAQAQGTINNDDAPTLRFSQAAYPAGESAHFVTVTVTRAGDPAQAVGVGFATSDGTATERRDYTAVSGTLQFAAGETSKTFDVLLTEDSYQEGVETINLALSNPTGGAILGTQATATVNLAADDNTQPQPNPIDDSANFVRQHYHDFLNREPDAPGLAFWVNDIEQCGADAVCREVKRINVSAAFFLSIEFQQTGYLVYRTYKAAYGDATSPNVAGTVPVIRLGEFLPDTRRIGEGVVVGAPNWERKLDANKDAYLAEFVQRPRFLTPFPATMTAAQFVDKLNQNAGGVLSQPERDGLVNELSAGAKTRAQVLRAVAESAALQQNEFRRAFVLMQFYGYLRRNPDDPQDTDFRGWKFWLDKLNEFNGNFVQAEMVKAFLDSIEYRTRFAP